VHGRRPSHGLSTSSGHINSNLKKVDAHQAGNFDYEDMPELPNEFFTESQLYLNGKPIDHRQDLMTVTV
jgi:hypothetical protein